MASVDETIEIIRETPISSVISFYHPLKKKGANYEGICPFHGDRHPSMVVSDQKGIFKCFACGAGGDAFKFVMDYANLEFLEAVKEVADKLGIQVEEAKKRQANPKADMALRIVKAAGKLYEKVGREVAPEHFKDFLTQRKLSEESVTNFSIGYAPANNSLTSYLSSIPDEKERSFALATAQEIGIIRKDQRGRGHYDFFRERVMFPVWDHSGVLRGFCGRTVLANQKAKYMNSVDSLIFDKGTILFGYNFAKKSVRQHEAVLIVEGHMDVIALHQYGFNYAVGTQGTAMSEANARMLAGAAKNIYLGMDSDPAGIKAMERINTMFMALNILPKFVDFSPVKDPDDFLKEFGRLELLNRMEKAKTFLDKRIEEAIPDPIPETVDQKLTVLDAIFELISPLKEGLLAKEKAVEASKTLGLRSSNEDILEAYKSYLKTQKQQFRPAKKASRSNSEQEAAQSENRIRLKALRDEAPARNSESNNEAAPQELSRPEKLLLETVLTHPECVQNEQIVEILDLIDHSEVKELIQWLKRIYLEIDESDYEHILQRKLSENYSRAVNDVVASALFQHNKLKLESKVVEKTLKDCALKLKVEKLKKQKRALANEQKASATEAESVEYLNKILEVEKELRDLKYNS